ncbi:hypothetical protein [Hymenobacter endophyticus]|uniref:XRE family transcriptional regulator n=1 Tax=Hymenobacter endophyticus TaxID=3076335 RepID=A0ABU3TKV7_9BACT|nr:hypothetical protein [Hymenobacter endophyticus]MDU0372009.1 hypothetical protein [Hymenobacter endophyticus]
MPRTPAVPEDALTIAPLPALRTGSSDLLELLRWRGVTQRTCREQLDIGWYHLNTAATNPLLFSLQETRRIAAKLEVEEMELVAYFFTNASPEQNP